MLDSIIMSEINILGTLSPADYWEWRTSVTELEKADYELKYRQCLLAMMEKDVELSRLRMGIYKQEIESFKDKVSSIKKDYEVFKKKLEDKSGYSLNNCVIDDVTFEVKKLD